MFDQMERVYFGMYVQLVRAFLLLTTERSRFLLHWMTRLNAYFFLAALIVVHVLFVGSAPSPLSDRLVHAVLPSASATELINSSGELDVYRSAKPASAFQDALLPSIHDFDILRIHVGVILCWR
jgi:hypothetical protein